MTSLKFFRKAREQSIDNRARNTRSYKTAKSSIPIHSSSVEMSQHPIKPVPATPAVTPRVRTLSTFSHARPVIFNAKHIDDIGRKRSMDASDRKDLRFDEGSLQLTNDPNSIIYRRLSETLGERVTTKPHLTDEEEKFKHFEKYGPELVDFLKDRDGHLKSKFDKVFIT